MFLIVHIENENESTNKTIKLLNQSNIKYSTVKSYSSNIKKNFINNFIKTLPINSWLIYPDLDEFFTYNNKTIPEFINQLEKKNFTAAKGIFFNRIGEYNEVKEMKLNEDIFLTFPFIFEDKNMNLTKKIIYDQTKIICIKKKDNLLQYLCSHNVNINLKIPTEYNRINHFKYTIYTIENILNKMKVYKDIEPFKYNLYKNQLSLIKKKNNKYYLENNEVKLYTKKP